MAQKNVPSVPLPRRENQSNSSSHPPVWAVSNAVQNAEAPLLHAKCDRHGIGRDGVCCKELRGDDERHLINPDVVRDAIIGLSDGLTVPFALAAGLSSLGTSKLVVYGGVAELIAGSISMGVGGFLASQSERDHYRYLRRQTHARISRSCSSEMEREVLAVLGPIGVDEKLSRQVAHRLREVEVDVSGEDSPINGTNGHTPYASSSATLTDEEVNNSGLRWSKDVGLTAFLLKFGEGLAGEEVPNSRMYISALTIGMGYLVGGFIPLIPYFFIPHAKVALIYSAIVTGITLLVFGAVKTHVSGAQGGLRGYVWGAVSTALVGGTAAAAAYGIVAALEAEG